MSDVVIGFCTRNNEELDAVWYERRQPRVIGVLGRPYLQAQWFLPPLRPRSELVNQIESIAALVIYVNDVPTQDVDLSAVEYDLLTVFPENTLNAFVPIAFLKS